VWPAGLFIGLSALSIPAAALALAVGVGVSLYFLNRKEKKFGRAILLTLIGLIIGIVVGLQIDSLFPLQIATIGLEAESFAAIVTFFILWLVSSFLR
jgi:FtsH-binding integral membrane protein